MCCLQSDINVIDDKSSRLYNYTLGRPISRLYSYTRDRPIQSLSQLPRLQVYGSLAVD